METLGTRIKYLRGQLTQEEFAQKLGVDRTTLSSWEVDRREPDLRTLSKIADMFSVSLDYLAGRQTTSAVIPIMDSDSFFNLPETLHADFALRITDNKLAAFGLNADDIAIFKKSSTAQGYEIAAVERDSKIYVCMFGKDTPGKLVGTLVAAVKIPSGLNKLNVYENELWYDLINYAISNNISPEQAKRLLEAAVMMKK